MNPEQRAEHSPPPTKNNKYWLPTSTARARLMAFLPKKGGAAASDADTVTAAHRQIVSQEKYEKQEKQKRLLRDAIEKEQINFKPLVRKYHDFRSVHRFDINDWGLQHVFPSRLHINVGGQSQRVGREDD